MLETHRLPNDIDHVDDIVEHPVEERNHNPCSFVAISILQILGGIVGVLLTVTLHITDTEAEPFINFFNNYIHISPYLLYVSSGVTIVSGIIALVAVIIGILWMLTLHSHLFWIILTLDILAALASFETWESPHPSFYRRILEADAANFMGDNTYISIFGKQFQNFTNRMHVYLKCCGINGPEDWYTSSFGKLIKECCLSDECWKEKIDFESELNNSMSKAHLWEQNCMQSLEQEIYSLQLDWITLPLIHLFLHVVQMVNSDHLIRVIHSEFKDETSEEIFQKFRSDFYIGIHSCFSLYRRKNQVAGSESLDELYKAEKEINPNESVPIFVTERKSLTDALQPNEEEKKEKEDEPEAKHHHRHHHKHHRHHHHAHKHTI